MCQFCLEYGNGKKWYLNEENYSNDLIEKFKAMNPMINMLGGTQKMDLEIGAAMNVDAMIPDHTNQEQLNKVSKSIEGLHGGQVIPLEEAFMVIDLAKSFILVPCYCRRHFGGLEDMMTCLFLNPVSEMVPKNRPWEKYELLSKIEAKKKLVEFDKKGYVHSVYWAPLPIPIVICNCQYPYCIGMKLRLDYKVENGVKKGHSIGVIDAEKCNGCEGKEAPLCVHKCQFGAIRWNGDEKKALINPRACFGCGVCRTACPQKAITLTDRNKWPALKDEY
ncbi:MAG: ATP-binding protein [Candidatus Helarchaeota archaeon]